MDNIAGATGIYGKIGRRENRDLQKCVIIHSGREGTDSIMPGCFLRMRKPLIKNLYNMHR